MGNVSTASSGVSIDVGRIGDRIGNLRGFAGSINASVSVKYEGSSGETKKILSIKNGKIKFPPQVAETYKSISSVIITFKKFSNQKKPAGR